MFGALPPCARKLGGALSQHYSSLRGAGLKLDDCIIVADNVAIADYLKTIQPEPPFIGVNAIGRALMLQLNNRAAAFFQPLATVKTQMDAEDPSSASRAQVS